MKNKNVFNKIKSIPEFISGSSTLVVDNNKQPAWKMLKQVQQLSNYKTTQGFTLIELLVVVLIIGILAAVALPQYNKAVKKSQGAETLVVIDAFDKALADYYLEHGTYEGVAADTLNIQIPTLKYAEYVQNNPRSGEFQTGSVSSDGNTTTLNLDLKGTYNSLVYASWEKGKLKIRRCGLSSKQCPSYFNCKSLDLQTGSCDF